MNPLKRKDKEAETTKRIYTLKFQKMVPELIDAQNPWLNLTL